METTNQDEVFTRHWTKAVPAVSAFVHSLVPDFHQAEDILQEVAVALFRKFDQYDATRPFVPWAIGMARNEILMQRRAQARSLLVCHSDIIEAVGDTCAGMEPEFEMRTQALRECLQKVGGRSRRIVRMRYLEQLKPQEIATQEGMSSGAMRILLFRIRRSLEDCVHRNVALERG